MVTIFTKVFSIKKNSAEGVLCISSDSLHRINPTVFIMVTDSSLWGSIEFLYTIYQKESAIFQQIVPWGKLHRYSQAYLRQNLNGYWNNYGKSFKNWELLDIYLLPNAYYVKQEEICSFSNVKTYT